MDPNSCPKQAKGHKVAAQHKNNRNIRTLT
jgi:hypothetical protein